MSPAYRENAEFVCRCRQLTREQLATAAQRCPLRSIRDVIRQTRAGDGCTSCHREIEALLRLGSS